MTWVREYILQISMNILLGLVFTEMHKIEFEKIGFLHASEREVVPESGKGKSTFIKFTLQCSY